ncbi:sulfotransferase [Neptunicella marina]|uniref:sulfotransferase n=1 Tax=Neptunicella marina TaxID=2125989 RepID=UPI0030CA5AD9
MVSPDKQSDNNISETQWLEQTQQLQQLIQQAKFSQAIEQATTLLQQADNTQRQADILYLLTVAERYANHAENSLQCVEQLLALNAVHARGWQEKGYIYLKLQQPDNAAYAFEQAVKYNPALIASWKLLVELYRHQNKTADAQRAGYQIEFLSSLPQALLAARDLMYDGKLHKADSLCRQYLQKYKHDIEGMCLLAEIGGRLRVFDDAEFLLESCVELAPDHQRARSEYVGLLIRLSKFSVAQPHVDELLKAQPDNPSFLIAKGSVEVGLGNIEAGIGIFRRVLTIQPDRAGVYVQLGHAYKANGQREQAIEAYQQAFKLNPSYGDAYWSLANTKTYCFSDAELQQIKQQEAQPDIAEDDRIHLCFAAGKALEDAADFDRSFEYYQRGNQLRHQQLGYQADNTDKQVDEQIAHCSTELFEQFADAGHDDPAPIFILGLPRAGSTLLEQILASHSMVDGTMELHNILGLAMRLRGRIAGDAPQYPANLTEIDKSYFARFGQQFIEQTQVYRQGAPFFIDKMPNNFMHIGLIKLILPNAKVIDARREPMACCFSGFKQLFGEGQDFSYSLHDIGRYYQSYLRMMEHWNKVLPGFVLKVQHEDVLDDLQGQVKRMLDFCGLPFEQSCVDFHKTKRQIKTPSSEQVRQPIFKSAQQQWKNYEIHLAELKACFS